MEKPYKKLKQLINEGKYREAFEYSSESRFFKRGLSKSDLIRLANFYEGALNKVISESSDLKEELEKLKDQVKGVLESKVIVK